MAEITRTSQAEWSGDLRSGKGQIVTESGVLQDSPYSFATRFEDKPGTNPEELIAAAHAACFGMAFSGVLSKAGYKPESISTRAVCVLEPKAGGGHQIARMQLNVFGKVPNMDQATFEKLAKEADQNCPVSNLLRPGLKIELEADLLEHAYSAM